MRQPRTIIEASRRRDRATLAFAGAVLTLAGVATVHEPRGLYWSDTRVYFLAPQADRAFNTYAYTTDSVIAMAGLVGRIVQPDATGAGTGTQTTLLAEGVRHGTEVRLPNSGGQWALNFDKPLLDVQVVGTTPAEVMTVTDRLLQRIRAAAGQVQAGVDFRSRMGLRQEPAQVQVHYSLGDPRRAEIGVLLAGGLLTTMISRAAGRRRRPPTYTSAPTVLGPAAAVVTTDAPRREPVGV